MQKCCYEITEKFHDGNFWEHPPLNSTKAATGYEEMKPEPRSQSLTKPFLYALTASFNKGRINIGPTRQLWILSFLSP